MRQDIYDIIARLLAGTISPEEMEQLDAWLDEDENHRKQYEAFMQRNDLLRMYNINKGEKKEKGEKMQKPKEEKAKRTWYLSAIAACALIIIGFFALHSSLFTLSEDGEVTTPILDTSTMAAISVAESSGHNNAEIVIRNADKQAISGITKTVGNDSILKALCQSVGTSRSTSAFGKDEDGLGAFSADIVTHHDKEFWMTLPDGTRVHLNYNTKLTYPLQFTGKNREVALEGEAYFFVAKDSRHPFIVHTRCGDVKEYGTEFNVCTRYDSQSSTGAYGIRGKGVAVVLVNGSISVISKNGKEHMMKPNDMAVIGMNGNPTIKQVDTAPFISWNTGTFSFEDCPLDRLMDVIGRWYGLEIIFRSDASRKIRFTGELDRYNDIHHDLSAISTITGLRIKAEGTQVFIE